MTHIDGRLQLADNDSGGTLANNTKVVVGNALDMGTNDQARAEYELMSVPIIAQFARNTAARTQRRIAVQLVGATNATLSAGEVVLSQREFDSGDMTGKQQFALTIPRSNVRTLPRYLGIKVANISGGTRSISGGRENPDLWARLLPADEASTYGAPAYPAAPNASGG